MAVDVPYFWIVHSNREEKYFVGDKIDPFDWQVVVQPHPLIGWQTQSRLDHYLWTTDSNGNYRWQGADICGLFQYLKDLNLVGFGRTLTQDDFDNAMRRAMKIREVERDKTGWLANETRPNS
jgi:hypothetical protein